MQLIKISSIMNALPENTELYVAVSGGLDSTCLLHVLVDQWKQKKLLKVKSISVLHVNHNLRGQESDEDAVFVRKLSRKFALPLFFKKIVWLQEETRSQEMARNKREAFYQEILLQNPNAFIVTAHHLNDQAETVFMRLLRGTGLQGLQGMSAVERRRVRPLLFTERSQIQSWAKQNQITWREDSSNKSKKYERNWLRLEIFPKLEKKRPGFAKRLVALATEAREHNKNNRSAVAINIENLRFYNKQTLKNVADSFFVTNFHCERKHIPLVRKLLLQDATRMDLPQACLWSSCGWILYGQPSAIKNFILKSQKSSNQNWTSDLGEWQFSGKLRARMQGDGTKIKQALMAKKVPAFLRHCIPVLQTDHHKKIILIPPALNKSCSWNINGENVHFTPSKLAQEIFSFQ